MDDFTIKYVDLINQQHVVSTGKQTYGFHNPKWRTEMVDWTKKWHVQNQNGQLDCSLLSGSCTPFFNDVFHIYQENLTVSYS